MARGQAVGAMVFNKPQLISLDSLKPITDYLSNPERVMAKMPDVEEPVILTRADFDGDEDFRRYKLSAIGVNPDTMVGVLDISGTLTYRAGNVGADCTELVSYESLKRQTEEMVEAGAETIVLSVDSGGGMAYGMFAAANYISKITKDSGVKTVAYVDGVSYSAAYGLSVLADEIVVNPDASVGSVGVVVALYNDSKMLEKSGVSREFVFAGDNKIPFDNSTGEFTDKFIQDLQKSVDKTYDKFVSHIAKHRGLAEKVIVDTQASVYDAEEALSLGLIDKVMELEDFELEYGLKVSEGHGKGVTATMSANQLDKEENMATTKDGVKDLKNTDDKMKLELESLKETNTELSDKLGMSLADLKQTQEDKKALEEKVAELTAQIQAAELKSRNDKRMAALQEVMGKENESLQMVLASTANLSDEDFEVIKNGFGQTQENLQKSLAEHGGEGQPAVTQLSLADQIKATAQKMKTK